MVARAWARIYVRNDPQAGQCVQMLLVAKFGQAGTQTWVAVDDVGRLQVIDVSVRARVASRPWVGINVGGLRGLSVVEKQRALTKARAMIAVQDAAPQSTTRDPQKGSGDDAGAALSFAMSGCSLAQLQVCFGRGDRWVEPPLG